MNNCSIAHWMLAVSASIAPGAPAVAANLGDFDCSRKIVALYQPGPNWAQFRERLAAHLDFVKAKLDQNSMAYGAPMSDPGGQPVGGLFVYNEPDQDNVAKLLEEDTFVKDRVVVYTLARWGMCRSKTFPK